MRTFLNSIEHQIIEYRRDFHKYAEPGWQEYRTASKIAEILEGLGYELLIGEECMKLDSRMGLPDQETLDRAYQNALENGAVERFAEEMKDGKTGIVAILENGQGPVLGFRFDIDALYVIESVKENHVPFREGFASINYGIMHSCGHDTHAAIGLGLAHTLMELKDQWKGTVKLIFQPAEEGVRGAKSIADSGVLDDIDILIGGHIGMGEDCSNTFMSNVGGFLATSKIDAHFRGFSAHAGGNPELGKNALLAAANATMALLGIPRHKDGATRINVGKLEAGTGRNVIPDTAFMMLETRGTTSELNEYMYRQAKRILEKSAEMYEVDVELIDMGGAKSSDSDFELSNDLAMIAKDVAGFKEVSSEPIQLGGSEDFSYMAERVKEKGGKSSYVIFGSNISAPHHNRAFDINENDLINAVELLSKAVLYYGK